VWDLLLVVQIDVPPSLPHYDLIGQNVASDGSLGLHDILLRYNSGGPLSQPTNLQLSAASPVVLSLSSNAASSQLIFGSLSAPTLSLDYLDVVTFFADRISDRLVHHITQFHNSDDLLLQLSSLLASEDASAFFDVPKIQFHPVLNRALTTLFRDSQKSLLLALFRFVTFLDDRVTSGGRISSVEGHLLLLALSVFPQFLSPVVSFSLNAKSPVVLLAVLINAAGFDPSSFARSIAISGREEPGAIWSILTYVLAHESEILASLVRLFELIVPLGRLQTILSANRITTEGDSLAKEISYSSIECLTTLGGQLEIDPTLCYETVPKESRREVAFEPEWAVDVKSDVAMARSNCQTDFVGRPGSVRRMQSGETFAVRPRNHIPSRDHLEVLVMGILPIVLSLLAWVCLVG
jgi:hypothetical protein